MDPKYDAGAHSRLDIPGKVMAYEALGKVRAEWLTVREHCSLPTHPPTE
jgi:hypothetical protein